MILDATEETFQTDVLERSYERPVLVDFWAPWCGPCRTLTPVLERVATERDGELDLVKLNTDEAPAISHQYGIQGIPAVKAFRDGRVVDEFVGVRPQPAVEAFVRRLVPSQADRLVEVGDEESLRRAVELEPNRADARVALARQLLGRGESDEAAALLRPVEHDPAAAGLLARAALAGDSDAPEGVAEALAALDRGEHEQALGGLLDLVPTAAGDTRDRIRQVMVGTFGELGDANPVTVDYRRRLARALY